MTWSDALLTAAIACALLCAAFLIFLEGDRFNPILRRKRLTVLRGPRDGSPSRDGSPFTGSRVSGELRGAMDPMLEAWRTADPDRLPSRMGRAMGDMSRRTLGVLRSRGIGRDLRLTEADSAAPNRKDGFVMWNDGGREWREGSVHAAVLERYVSLSGGAVLRERYYPEGILTVRQSRRIRAAELEENARETKKAGKGKGKTAFYRNAPAMNCPSCGAELIPDSAEFTCPYCGAVMRSDFYDWQTESFRFEAGMLRELAPVLLPFAGFYLLFAVLNLTLFGTDGLMILVGLGAALIGAAVLTGIFAALIPDAVLKNREKKIVRYSERLFQTCIYKHLWEREASPDTVDFVTSPLTLTKVTEEGDRVRAEVKVPVEQTLIGENGEITVRRRTYRGAWIRAKYPARLKSAGEQYREKYCPSCGANWDPDEEGLCSWCGALLREDTTLWKPVEP